VSWVSDDSAAGTDGDGADWGSVSCWVLDDSA